MFSYYIITHFIHSNKDYNSYRNPYLVYQTYRRCFVLFYVKLFYFILFFLGLKLFWFAVDKCIKKKSFGSLGFYKKLDWAGPKGLNWPKRSNELDWINKTQKNRNAHAITDLRNYSLTILILGYSIYGPGPYVCFLTKNHYQ